jgi:two-component sensor histidine kinase
MAPQPPPEVAVNLSLALVASSTAPLLLLDRDLRVVAASASFCWAFGIDPARVAGSRLGELGAGEWNISQLVSLLNATASGYAKVESYEMDLLRKGHPARRLVLNAQKLHYGDEDTVRLVLSVADVTDARIAEKLKEDLVREKDVLLQELHHRVANSLQIIASVLMQSARKVQSEETRIHLVDAHQRVMSVAALQKQLAVTRLGDVELRPYFTALCESIGASMISDRERVSLGVTTDDSITTADTSVSLGLIVTELVINALKHAFPDNRPGRIAVNYLTRGANWTLSVDDDGVGIPQNPDNAKPGLGTGIVQALAKQLGAEVDVVSKTSGTKVSIVHTFVPVLVSEAAARSGRAV